MRKLDGLAADVPDTYKLTGQDEVFKTYSFPKSHNLLLAEDLVKMMIAKNKVKGD